MSKKSLILSIPILVLAVLLGGWLVVRRSAPVSGPASVAPTAPSAPALPPIEPPTAPPTETGSGSAIDTSDWKTYRNEEYGFELKYPEEYELSENDQWPRFFQAVFSNAKSATDFQVKVTSKDTESNESFNFYLDHLASSKYSLSGKEANLFILEKGYCDGPGCSPPMVALKVDLGNRFLVLDFTGVRDISEDFPQTVMKGFRFLP